VNGSHRFSLRGSDSASSGRGKIPQLWPMPERAKPCGEYSEGIFLPTSRTRGERLCHTRLFVPNWERTGAGGLHDGSAHHCATSALAVMSNNESVRIYCMCLSTSCDFLHHTRTSLLQYENWLSSQQLWPATASHLFCHIILL